MYHQDLQKKADQYGVQGYQHGRTDKGTGPYRGVQEVEKDIVKAAGNDYQTQEFLQLVGNEDLKKKLKEEGKWNEKINKAFKVASKGNGITNMDDLEKVEKGFAEFGNQLNTHNNRGDFDVRDKAGTIKTGLENFYDMFNLDENGRNKKKDKDDDDDKPYATDEQQERIDELTSNVRAAEDSRRWSGARSAALSDKDYEDPKKVAEFDRRAMSTKKSPMEFANHFKKQILKGNWDKSQRAKDSRFDVSA